MYLPRHKHPVAAIHRAGIVGNIGITQTLVILPVHSGLPLPVPSPHLLQHPAHHLAAAAVHQVVEAVAEVVVDGSIIGHNPREDLALLCFLVKYDD